MYPQRRCPPAARRRQASTDEDGEFFVEQGGEVFLAGLRSFRSFCKSFTYGEGSAEFDEVKLYLPAEEQGGAAGGVKG